MSMSILVPRKIAERLVGFVERSGRSGAPQLASVL
jgi:hypothetical protein